MRRVIHLGLAAAALALSSPARADVLDIIGDGLGPVDISSNTLLWNLVGGVQTTGTNGNNPNVILRYYVVARGSNGTSVFSLGEIDPNFGGTSNASTSPYVSDAGGSLSLIDPGSGASGRDVSNLNQLQVLAVPSLTGNGGQSAAVQLSGLVTNPGSYNQAALQGFSPSTLTVKSGDTYTGVGLWTFIDPSNTGDARSEIVTVAGTDGYQVVLSLAELDPALGGNPNDLLPYAATGGDFPADGVARIILPGDDNNKHGRWVSNVDLVEVAAVAEPSAWAMMLPGLCGLGFLACRNRRAPHRPA